MDQQQRKPARALAHVRQLDAVAPRRGGSRRRRIEVERGNARLVLAAAWRSDRYDPQADRAQVAADLGRRAHLGGRRTSPTTAPARPTCSRCCRTRRGEPHIGHLKVYSVGDAIAHFRRRNGPPRAAPDGLRRVRPARREPRDQDRPAPARVDRGVDRRVPAPVPRAGGSRSTGRASSARTSPRYYRWTQWLFLRFFERGPRLPQGGRGQLVPEGRDRARQRAGDRRPLRALRHRGRGRAARAVVLPDHRLRRPAARRPRDDRLAAARRRRCSATGSAAPRAPRSSSAARSSASTTRSSPRGPDTLFGATFFVMAPEHPDVLGG